MDRAPKIEAVIFDMDGTITEPLLDFAAIRAEIGIAEGLPLLEALSPMTPPERRRAEEILLAHELSAARRSTLSNGVVEVLASLREAKVKTAILTRNCRDAVDIVLEKHGLRFDAVVTREDSRPKPDPDGVLTAAGKMGVEAVNCLVVGDFEFDILAGLAAGATTVHYLPGSERFATKPDFEIVSMRELPGVLRTIEGG
jgi:HAD superfamily hydrolase (TIGR01509 family)